MLPSFAQATMPASLALIALSWAIGLTLFLTAGSGLRHLLGIRTDEGRPLWEALVTVLTGMAAVSAVWGLASLAVPVDAWLLGVTVLLSLAMLGVPGVRGQWASVWHGIFSLRWTMALVALAGMAAAVIASYVPTVNHDSGLYYSQFIQWMNTYPAVPGLANLHGRFGFNSHWHLLQAGLNGIPLLDSPLNDIGGMLVCLLVLASAEAGAACARGRDVWLQDRLLALGLLPAYLLMRLATSESPDLAAAVLGFVVLVSAIGSRSGDGRDAMQQLAVLVAFLVTVKVNTVFIALAAMPLVLRADARTIGQALLLGLMVVLPWMARNHVQTGYLVYPASATAMLPADWRVPDGLLTAERIAIGSHARFGTYGDAAMAGAPPAAWLGGWAGRQSRAVLLLLVLAAVYVPAMGAWLLWRWRKDGDDGLGLAAWAAVSASLVFWLASAPNPRFAYAVLFFAFAHTGAALSHGFPSLGNKAFAGAVALGALLMLSASLSLTDEPRDWPERAFVQETSHGLTYLRPATGDQCWDAPLPCAKGRIEGVVMRGEGLREGFRPTARDSRD